MPVTINVPNHNMTPNTIARPFPSQEMRDYYRSNPRVRQGTHAPPTSPPTSPRPLIDSFGNVFTPQITAASGLAQRRERKRATQDRTTASAEHAAAWQQYVYHHDGFFEEQADVLRAADRDARCEVYQHYHPEVLRFRPVNFDAPATKRDSPPVSPRTQPSEVVQFRTNIFDTPGTSRDSPPVSPRTQPSEAEGSTEDSEEGGRFVEPADLRPLDLEAQAGLSPQAEESVSGLFKSFAKAIAARAASMVENAFED